MMRFERVPEPPEFDQKVRQRGNVWLAKNPEPRKRLPDYWSVFKSYLADGFGNLCGYSAMYEPVGTVDHYLSRKHYRHLAYEWSNYRFPSGKIDFNRLRRRKTKLSTVRSTTRSPQTSAKICSRERTRPRFFAR